MTEQEWLVCSDPEPMLEFVQQASSRRLRLFSCACCRRIWHLLDDKDLRDAVALSERYADQVSAQQDVIQLADQMLVEWPLDRRLAAYYALNPNFDFDYSRGGFQAVQPSPHNWLGVLCCAQRASEAVSDARTPNLDEVEAEETEQCHLLRDIFGDPFRAVAIDQGWLTWRDATIPKLAQAAYAERELPSGHLDSKRLAILADALEEAGCTNEDVLAHLRGAGPHVRGCWVVDLLLGKE